MCLSTSSKSKSAPLGRASTLPGGAKTKIERHAIRGVFLWYTGFLDASSTCVPEHRSSGLDVPPHPVNRGLDRVGPMWD